MQIQTFQGGFDKNLCYIIWCEETKLAALVDASVEINPILEYIESNNLILTKILITHTHHDHVFYLNDFIKQISNISVYCFHKPININFSYIGLINHQIINIGSQVLIALHTPGHFIDSLCFWDKNNKLLFTGDTMFVGRTGRTVSNTSNIQELYHSIYNILLRLPDDTIIYPGHHYGHINKISLKENVAISKFFTCKTFKDFCLVMQHFEQNR